MATRIKKTDFKLAVPEWGEFQSTLYEPVNWRGTKRGLVFAPSAFPLKIMYTWVGEYFAGVGIHTLCFSCPDPSGKTFKDDGEYWSNQWSAGLVEGHKWMRENCDIDSDRIAIAGHSMGANGVLLASYYLKDVCSISLAPGYPDPGDGEHDEMDEIMAYASLYCSGPTMIMVGTNDGFCGADASVKHFDQVPSGNKQLIKIKGGNHNQFMDVGVLHFFAAIAGLFAGDNADISHREQLKQAQTYMLDFLSQYL